MKNLEMPLRSAATSRAAYDSDKLVTKQSKVSRVVGDRRYDGMSAD